MARVTSHSTNSSKRQVENSRQKEIGESFPKTRATTDNVFEKAVPRGMAQLQVHKVRRTISSGKLIPFIFLGFVRVNSL